MTVIMLFYLILNHLIKIYYSLYKIKVFTLSIELIFICQYKYHASRMVCIDLDVHILEKCINCLIVYSDLQLPCTTTVNATLNFV